MGYDPWGRLDQLPTKERIESRSQLVVFGDGPPECWISYPQRKELKADHNHADQDPSAEELDQLPTKERIESRSQPVGTLQHTAGRWISYPQRKELKADHNVLPVMASPRPVGSATHKGKN